MLGSAPDGEPILNQQVMCLHICNNNTEGRGPWCLLGKSEIADSFPALAFKFQINKMFSPCLIVNIEYCGSLRDRELVCSSVDQQGSISNPVSGGQ